MKTLWWHKRLFTTCVVLKAKKGYFAIKLDLAKAYDNLSWCFVECILNEASIPEVVKYHIMEVISTNKMCVQWKGAKGEYFNAKKGLRQGDPLSPYLLVLCINKLSHLILDFVEASQWDCLKFAKGGPKVSHLMFADDLILFGAAMEKQIDIMLHILHIFC